MMLADQYAFRGSDHFDQEEVMQVPRSFISNDVESWYVTWSISSRSAPTITRLSAYSRMLIRPVWLVLMNREESDFDGANPILRNCCVIQARGAWFSPYNDFFNRQTIDVFRLDRNPGGCTMYTCSSRSLRGNAFFTSIWCKCHSLSLLPLTTHKQSSSSWPAQRSHHNRYRVSALALGHQSC